MGIFKKLKHAIKNPPVERLARIEYQSHFLQILGTSIVCVILVSNGLWYIIFAFIFSLGINYSSGMNAYKKYVTLMSMKTEEDFETDISFTRKRSNIIKSVLGNKINWVCSAISVILAALIINPIGARWYEQIALLVLIFSFWVVIYFIGFYMIAYPIYKRRKEKK